MRYTDNDKLTILREVSSIVGEAANTAASTEAERVLEILINIQGVSRNTLAERLKENKDPDYKFLVNYYRRFLKSKNLDMVDTYARAIGQIRKLDVGTRAVNVGSQSYPTTMTWRKYGGIPSTKSKSDVVTSRKSFSVKNASTQVRVLDASMPQLRALINYTIQATGVSDQLHKTIEFHLNKMKKLQETEGFVIKSILDKEGKTMGLSDMRKLASRKTKMMIAEFDKNTEDINKSVNAIFKAVNNTPRFKSVFINESMSGKTMFGPDSEARADAVLAFTSDFSAIRSHNIQTITKSILNSFTMPKIGTKKMGGRITKTFQAYYKNISESMDEFDVLVEREEELLHRSNMGMITEGVFADMWDSIKQKGKVILEKILEAFKAIIFHLIDFLKFGWGEVCALLGIDAVIEPVDDYATKTFEDLFDAKI